MNAEVTREVPNWREVNKDPRFLAWLRKPNIYTGKSNQDLLNEAARSADAQRVAAFFKGFLSEEKSRVTGLTPPRTRRNLSRREYQWWTWPLLRPLAVASRRQVPMCTRRLQSRPTKPPISSVSDVRRPRASTRKLK